MTDSPAHSHDHPPAASSGAASPEGHVEWDERYSGAERVWSGQPNGALVAETRDLPPGRALDVGCGEGADAIWMARQGWDVVALDVSQVALGRARQAAEDAGVTVCWLHAGLLDAPLASDGFDLVSAQYPALLRTQENEAVQALLAAVTPGGTLLMVHHAEVVGDHAHAPGFDPADYVMPEDVAALLGEDWEIETDERRSRDIRGGGGAHHTEDLVLKARKLTGGR